MKPRDQVLMALDHKEPDRCPMQISFTPEFANCLRAEMKLKGEKSTIRTQAAKYLRTGTRPGRGFAAHLCGLGQFLLSGQPELCGRVGALAGDRARNCASRFHMGTYTKETVGHPLANDSAFTAYEPPDPHRPELYAKADWVLRTFKDEYFVLSV